MRIADQSFYSRLLAGLELQRQRTELGISQLADGKRVRVASDDPSAHQASLGLRARLTRIIGYDRSGATARTDLATIDQVLGQAINIFTEARTIAFAGSTPALDSTNEIRAVEVEALRDQLLSLANKEQSGRYLFGGTETRTPPFDAAGVYSGNNDEVDAALDPQERVGATLSGQRVFLDGADLFAQLSDLAQALRDNDRVAVAATLPGLTPSLEYLSEIRGEIGNRLNRIDDISEAHANESLTLISRISDLEDVNIAETIVELQSADTATQALSAAASRFLGRSLFDYLG